MAGTPRKPRKPSGTRAQRIRDIEERKSREALQKLGEPVPVENAYKEMKKFAGEVIAFKNFLRDEVLDIQVTDWRFVSTQGLEQIHGLVQLFERAMDRTGVVLANLARAQVDEHLAAIEELRLLMLLAALRGALTEGGIDPTLAARIIAAFARNVQVIKDGEVITGDTVTGQKAIEPPEPKPGDDTEAA